MEHVFGHSEHLRGVGIVHDEVRRLGVLIGALELAYFINRWQLSRSGIFHIFINFTLKYLYSQFNDQF